MADQKSEKGLKWKWGVTYRLLDGSKHAAFDVSDGLGVDAGEFVDQPVVQRKQGKVEEQTLPHSLFSPGSSHLCLSKKHRVEVRKVWTTHLVST